MNFLKELGVIGIGFGGMICGCNSKVLTKRKKPIGDKAKIQWLKDMDKNTQYFHASIVQRKKVNRIEQLKKETGGWCNNEEEVVEEISSYYAQLFTTEDSFDWVDKLHGIPSTITNSMNSELIKPVDDDEIKRALFSMNPQKASEIDGMTPLFSKLFGML